MMYPFMTLNDNTEIVHSEVIEKDGREQVKVCIEKPVFRIFLFYQEMSKACKAPVLRAFLDSECSGGR